MKLITLGGKTNGCHFRLRFDCRILLVVALLLSDFCKSDLEEMAQTPSAVLRFHDIMIRESRDYTDDNNGDNKETEINIPEPPSKEQLQRTREKISIKGTTHVQSHKEDCQLHWISFG